MSKQAFHQVVGRMVVDAEFRSRVVEKGEKALSRYDLTATEIQKILALDVKTVEQLSEQINQRFTPKKFEIG
jgi:hypothetical protein